MGAGSPLFMQLNREGSAAAISALREPTSDVVTAHTLATDDMLAHLRPLRGTSLACLVAHGVTANTCAVASALCYSAWLRGCGASSRLVGYGAGVLTVLVAYLAALGSTSRAERSLGRPTGSMRYVNHARRRTWTSD